LIGDFRSEFSGVGSKAFGSVYVRGRIRVPIPAARITPSSNW